MEYFFVMEISFLPSVAGTAGCSRVGLDRQFRKCYTPSRMMTTPLAQAQKPVSVEILNYAYTGSAVYSAEADCDVDAY